MSWLQAVEAILAARGQLLLRQRALTCWHNRLTFAFCTWATAMQHVQADPCTKLGLASRLLAQMMSPIYETLTLSYAHWLALTRRHTLLNSPKPPMPPMLCGRSSMMSMIARSHAFVECEGPAIVILQGLHDWSIWMLVPNCFWRLLIVSPPFPMTRPTTVLGQSIARVTPIPYCMSKARKEWQGCPVCEAGKTGGKNRYVRCAAGSESMLQSARNWQNQELSCLSSWLLAIHAGRASCWLHDAAKLTEPNTFWMTCWALPGSPLMRSMIILCARSTASCLPEMVIWRLTSGGKFCKRQCTHGTVGEGTVLHRALAGNRQAQ